MLHPACASSNHVSSIPKTKRMEELPAGDYSDIFPVSSLRVPVSDRNLKALFSSTGHRLLHTKISMTGSLCHLHTATVHNKGSHSTFLRRTSWLFSSLRSRCRPLICHWM